jgi:hypothetical protein
MPQYQKREVSVLRDDLYTLFQRLVLLSRNKLSCLENINANEIQLRYQLNSDNVAGINDLIRNDNEIFIKLDSIEFDIQSLIITICKTAGIQKDNFEKFFLTRDEEPLPDIKKLKDIINKQMSELITARDKLIKDMGNHLEGIKINIESLKKIRDLDIKNQL